MLAYEIRGATFEKAVHNRDLQRTGACFYASIKCKHCDITAVLEELGIAGIVG